MAGQGSRRDGACGGVAQLLLAPALGAEGRVARAIRLEQGSELGDPGPARGKRSLAAPAPVTPTSASQPGFHLGP